MNKGKLYSPVFPVLPRLFDVGVKGDTGVPHCVCVCVCVLACGPWCKPVTVGVARSSPYFPPREFSPWSFRIYKDPAPWHSLLLQAPP